MTDTEKDKTELESILRSFEDSVTANYPDEIEVTYHRTERVREILKRLIDRPNRVEVFCGG